MTRLYTATRVATLSLYLVGLQCIASCSNSTEIPDETVPVITAVDRQEVVLGETVFFQGQRLLPDSDGAVRLNLIGTYITEDGQRIPVDMTITPLFDGGDEERQYLRWSRFGPFEHPFMQGDEAKPGTFEGQVYPINVPAEGEATFGQPHEMSLKVLPSISIELWEPVVADCGKPALRGLGGLAYIMKVRAIGFEPTVFRYSLGQTNGDELVFIEREATGKTDVIGGPERTLLLNDIPDELAFYTTSWAIEAEDAEGNVYENILPFSVHRPIDHYTDPKLREAEFMEPVPVSSCFRGGIGTDVVYSESVSETRQNTASVTLSRSWSVAQGQSESEQWRDSVSISNSDARNRTSSTSLNESGTTSQSYGVSYNQSGSNQVNYATTDGESWGWSLSTGETVGRSETGTYERSQTSSNTWGGEANAGADFGVFSIGGGGNYSHGTTSGSRESVSQGSSYQARNDRGFSAQSNRSDTRSFGSTTTDSRGGNITGSYAVSTARTMTNSEGQTVTVSEGRTLELGGSSGRSMTLTEGESEAYQQTFSHSNTSTTLTSYDGYVPRSKFGVFYRQTTRLIRTSYVRSYDLCGVSTIMGEVQLSEWIWAPDLALGDQCPPFPESNLPPAQCLIEPCGGQ